MTLRNKKVIEVQYRTSTGQLTRTTIPDVPQGSIETECLKKGIGRSQIVSHTTKTIPSVG